MADARPARFTGGERIDCAIQELDLNKRKVTKIQKTPNNIKTLVPENLIEDNTQNAPEEDPGVRRNMRTLSQISYLMHLVETLSLLLPSLRFASTLPEGSTAVHNQNSSRTLNTTITLTIIIGL